MLFLWGHRIPDLGLGLVPPTVEEVSARILNELVEDQSS